VGLDAESARYSAGAYARVPGRLRYIAAGLRALCWFEALGVRAEFPEGAQPNVNAKVLIAGALNTPSYGAGLRLAPEARIDDGLLTAIFVKKLSVAQVLAAVPRLMTRGDLPEAYLTRVNAARVRLSANRECLFHGDGEILGPAPVEIEVVPRAVRMLGPAAAESA
jgi:diacylglycerol kinase (ATP)